MDYFASSFSTVEQSLAPSSNHEYQTLKLALVARLRAYARRVLELLLHLRDVSVYARLSVGQPRALRDRGCVAVHGFAAWFRRRSPTPDRFEDRQFNFQPFESCCVRDVCLYDLHRRTCAAGFKGRATRGPASS